MGKQTKNDAMEMFKKFNSVKAAPKVKESVKKESTAEEESVPVVDMPDEVVMSEPVVKDEPVMERTESIVKPSPVGDKVININMGKGKRKEKKSQRTFYMKDSVFEKLKERAEENGAGISEYLGFILEQAL